MHHPLLALALALAAASCAVPGIVDSSAAQARPNILFIMIDDLGWMDIRPQGNDGFVTPNLDRLAVQGTRFTDFYAAAPVCSPTRAACITGLAPARLKVTNHIPDRWSFYDDRPVAGEDPAERCGREWGPGRSRDVLDKKYRTIAQRLQAAGYNTGFIGKWHLAGSDWRTTDTALFPESFGFDVNVAGNAMGGPGTFFAPFRLPNYQKGEVGDYLPDLLAEEAVDYLESVKDDARPFFLCLWTYTVHYPIEAPAELYAHYTERRNADGAVVEPDMPTRYRAMVEGMDLVVGRVLRALDEMQLSANTLVVFTSDNGQMPGASVADPLRGAKGYLYEGGIRVPMILRWPGHVRAGAVDSTPAISMDFAPTFLDAAGIDFGPDEFDGESLLPIAAGTGSLQRDAIYLHYPHYCYHGENDMGAVVRSGDYKYIHHFDNDDHELFDLGADLGEQVNLYGSEPAKVAELRGRLMAWLESTGAELPRRYESIPAAELPGQKRTAFEPLLVPGSFAGWHTAPGGEWRWQGDVLVGTSPASEPRHGLLISDRRYRDFEARFEFRVVSGDSGFYFRVDEVGGATGVAGFQAEVDPTAETGGLYETGGRAWVSKPDPELMATLYRAGEWARMSVRAAGGNIDVHLNGQRTARLRDDPGRREGHFAFQLHGNQDLHVEFRNVELRELDD